MRTVTLRYDEKNALINSILHSVVLAGGRLIDLQKPVDEFEEGDAILTAYQQMFGKRKGNKYTDNEVFIFNSKLNASKAFVKYL